MTWRRDVRIFSYDYFEDAKRCDPTDSALYHIISGNISTIVHV